jgi:hypothetical protein
MTNNIKTVHNLNAKPTKSQNEFFKTITGYDLPPQVCTRGGASEAIMAANDAKKNMLAPMAQLRLPRSAMATSWDNTTRRPATIPLALASGDTLDNLHTQAQQNAPVQPAPAQPAPAQPAQTQGGSMGPNGVNIPVPTTSAPDPKEAKEVETAEPEAVEVKPAAPKEPPAWKKALNEPIQGFTVNPELEHRVPKVGPNGLPIVDGKEIRFVTRACDEEMWYLLRKFKKVVAKGKSGCGKDMSLIAFAAQNKLPHKVFPFCGSARVEDLFGHRDLEAKNGGTESPYIMHDDLKIMIHGGVLVLSEFNAGSMNEVIAFNDTFEARKATVQRTGKSYDFHEHAYLAMNFNPGYEGTKSINDATLGRFNVVDFPAWSKDELYQLLGPINEFDNLAELYIRIQRAMDDTKNGLRGGIISIRNLLSIASMLKDGVDLNTALHMGFLNHFTCNSKDRTYYNAAFLIAQHLWPGLVSQQGKV